MLLTSSRNVASDGLHTPHSKKKRPTYYILRNMHNIYQVPGKTYALYVWLCIYQVCMYYTYYADCHTAVVVDLDIHR